jgi:hypothetical protein
MTRGIFGWSLPPGCSHQDIEEAAGVDLPCEVCGKAVDDCTCPECKVCGCIGDPSCYHSHGLTRTQEQIDSLAAQLKED